jgi:hypothetical protein
VRHSCAPSARRALDRQAADVMLARGRCPSKSRFSLPPAPRRGTRSRSPPS